MKNIDISTFEEKGIIKVQNFLQPNELNRIKGIVKYYSFPKDHPESVFSSKIRHLFYKLLKFKFKKFNHHLQIIKLLKKKELNKISNTLFKRKSYLEYIDGYCSPISNKEVLPWHTDQAYSGKIENFKSFNNPDHYLIKFFIYLTDVGPKNGCMSYIPGSHKISYLIRKGIFLKILKYEPYWKLNDFRKFVLKKENYNYIKNELEDKKAIDVFLSRTEFVEKNIDNSDYDYSMSAGDAIIFNEGGVHKGSETSKTERVVLRFMFRLKD